jgi:1-aminocyclopropane-1-carboxylate deaminase/D-cysteine desulfhydrase-like pyridoxal-dependent ACC family enzyme
VGSNSKFSNIKFMVSETRICMLHENNVRSLAVEIFLKRDKMLSGNVLVVHG